MVEAAERILTKEKIDRQLAGQSSSMPFMNKKDGYSSKNVVTFDMQDKFDDNIDKLTSMNSKLTAQGNNQNKQLKTKIYQGKSRGQTRNYYHQGNYQNRYRSNIGDRRTSFRGRGQHGQNYRGGSQYVNTYREDFRRDNFGGMQNYRGQNFRGGYRVNYRNHNFGIGRSRSTERQYSVNFKRNDRRSSRRSRSGLRVSTNRYRIRCFKCRECNDFTKDCPNSQTEKEPEQIQQMYNLNENQTGSNVLAADIYGKLIRMNSDDAIVDALNL